MTGSDTSTSQGRQVRQRMLEFIVEYTTREGWAPSYREIAAAVGLASRSTVMSHLYQLQAEGKLVLGSGPRMIRIVK